MRLTCACGSPWGPKGCGPCKKCLARLDRDCREFERGVFFGEHDADGYKPGERKDAREAKPKWRAA